MSQNSDSQKPRKMPLLELMEYKGYTGEFYFDETRLLFQGKVSNIKYPLTFKGKSMESLGQDFHDVVNDYLDWCKKRGAFPEKPLIPKKTQ